MGKTIIILVIAAAFVIGMLVSITPAFAPGQGLGDSLVADAIDQLTIAVQGIPAVQGPQGEQGPEGPPGSSGSEMPISIGDNRIQRTNSPCPVTPFLIKNAFGAPILLADGTVKVPAIGGGLKTADPLFGSLPAGVWHDIEGTSSSKTVDAGCFPDSLAFASEDLRACAVAENGDVFCVLASINDGVLFGSPSTWTFEGDAIP